MWRRLIVWSIDWSVDSLFDRLCDWLIDWLIDWSIVWLIDCMIDRLIEWFDGCNQRKMSAHCAMRTAHCVLVFSKWKDFLLTFWCHGIFFFCAIFCETFPDNFGEQWLEYVSENRYGKRAGWALWEWSRACKPPRRRMFKRRERCLDIWMRFGTGTKKLSVLLFLSRTFFHDLLWYFRVDKNRVKELGPDKAAAEWYVLFGLIYSVAWLIDRLLAVWLAFGRLIGWLTSLWKVMWY